MIFRVGLLLLLTTALAQCHAIEAAEPQPELTVAVMDPMALQLSCDCVKGYAQRDYQRLGRFLEKRLGRKVNVIFAKDLDKAFRDTGGFVDLVIGKQSAVTFDAAKYGIKVRPLAMLTGLDGKTTMTGLFVVPSGLPARKLADLKDYRILFGPEAAVEKHAAALAALRAAGVAVPKKLEIHDSCSEAALVALDSNHAPGTAAVISSYAQPLLVGCETIGKGELRIVGHTTPVPFITAFATELLPREQDAEILEALLAVAHDKALLRVMESKRGFVKMPPPKPAQKKTTDSWPGWRGANRDGLVPWLPERLAETPNLVWQKKLTGKGLSGIAATGRYVVVADRDDADTKDVFRCLDPDSGRELWKLEYPASGDLDYGNSPRATPLIDSDRVFLLGAFGHLHCVRLTDGRVIWKTNLLRAFGARLPTWGMCASPLLVDGRLIVNPGAERASLVALNPTSGKVIWKTPGPPAAYASFIVGTFGSKRQIVGYDELSLGGWDIATGKRLWRLVPEQPGDFNVPTPIDLGNRLLVASENNGTRVYQFDQRGKIRRHPVAQNDDLASDTGTPVVVAGRVLGCWNELLCLDLANRLDMIWSAEDKAYRDYVSLIAADDRVLVTTGAGELILIRATGPRAQVISRMRLFDDDTEVISHPALVGTRLFVRDSRSILCVELE